MKIVRMLLVVTTIVVGTAAALELEDYVKGVVDEYGNNLWHVLAHACDKPYYQAYLDELASIDATEQDEDILSFLASERNNKYQSSLEIAAVNWAHNECKQCSDLIKMIVSWQTVETTGHRSKKINSFRELLKNNKETVELTDSSTVPKYCPFKKFCQRSS